MRSPSWPITSIRQVLRLAVGWPICTQCGRAIRRFHEAVVIEAKPYCHSCGWLVAPLTPAGMPCLGWPSADASAPEAKEGSPQHEAARS
jgi:hypothetical protein